MPITSILPVLLLLLPSAGHMISGAIAYDLLKEQHPAELDRALTLMRQHPQYNDVISRRLESVEPEHRDRYLFMLAARWADDIRTRREYYRGPWHYINLPVVAVGFEGEPPGAGGAVVRPSCRECVERRLDAARGLIDEYRDALPRRLRGSRHARRDLQRSRPTSRPGDAGLRDRRLERVAARQSSTMSRTRPERRRAVSIGTPMA